VNKEKLKSLPTTAGVYIFKDKNAKILYVGKAKDIKKRVFSYFAKPSNLDAKTLLLREEVHKVEHIPVSSEIEAFLLEASLIKKYKPFYNIKLSDDKSYPYICISKTKIPYVAISRKKNSQTGEYYGPYPNVLDVKTVLRTIRKIFPYQSIKNHPKKRCLFNHIGMCPCIPFFPQNLFEYKSNLKKMKAFLKGDKEKVLNLLLREQKKYIKDEKFEKASMVQKQIEQVNLITSDNYQAFRYEERPDLYYERIKNELYDLKQIFQTNNIKLTSLERIECYDISNIQGKNATASLVVFIKGHASKKDYRRFKIKLKSTPDDFFMIQEVLLRRLKHKEWQTPNLIVVDGGKGQVGAALKVLFLHDTKIPVIGLAKKEEIIIVPAVKNDYSVSYAQVRVPFANPGLNLLKRIRDEAHRFAITYHRLLRQKKFLNEELHKL